MLFHQDNAPAHTSVIAMAAINDCGFRLIKHPPNSPDFAPSDFHLFSKLKKAISGTLFQSGDDDTHIVEDFLDSQEKDFFKSDMGSLQHRWQKCIDIEGDYVENLYNMPLKTLHARLTIFQSVPVILKNVDVRKERSW